MLLILDNDTDGEKASNLLIAGMSILKIAVNIYFFNLSSLHLGLKRKIVVDQAELDYLPFLSTSFSTTELALYAHHFKFQNYRGANKYQFALCTPLNFKARFLAAKAKGI